MTGEARGTMPSIEKTENPLLFWGCFIALVTTAFGFIARMFLINTWAEEFSLDPARAGALAGIGIWPFAVSIIGFSLLIDRIGYKVSMIIAFLGHLIWACMGVAAYFVSQGGDKQTAYNLLYWGSLILALGNGTVEAFINPVVATMFSRDKTKWLNILHAGWPGGLVVAGMVTIFIDFLPWWVKVGMIALPAVLYFVMLIGLEFPVQERVSSGVTYREMLAEFGILGALVVGFLITLQLIEFFSGGGSLSLMQKGIFIGIGALIVVAFGIYTQSFGRILMFGLVLIMMPLATTEIGTDGWITGIMEPIAAANGFHSGWVLVYTSVIMMILRFFAGPIVHSLKPLPLLAVSAVLAIVGLYTLSFASGILILIAATLYGFGKTFFWPTMLGVVSEQTPKGGALTLNAISGIGMLAVGVLGFPYIGTLQANKEIQALVADQEIAKKVPGLVEGDKLTVVEDREIYEIITYQAISQKSLKAKIDAIPNEADREAVKKRVDAVLGESKQGALGNMIVFPIIMLVGYVILIIYFQVTGGYKQVHLDEGKGDHANIADPPPPPKPPADHPHGITDKPPTGIKE
jgi:MFS family permease